MELWHIPLLLFVGVIAGFFNTLAGGGSLLTLPVLIFTGLPPAIANGTNRIGIFVQTASAVYAFRKRGFSSFKYALILAIPAVIGSFIGAKIAIDIDETLFKKVLAVVMVLVLAHILLNKSTRLKNDSATLRLCDEAKKSKVAKSIPIIVFFLIGLYGGFLQAGAGFLIIAALRSFTDYDLIMINAVKVFIALIFTTIALGTFIWAGKVNWIIGLTLAAGMSTGAWLGAHYGVKKGENWIKAVLTIAIIAFSIKLFLF